jgi:hypothetical protein
LVNTANSNKQKNHSQWKLTQKTTFQAKHTSKNVDHLEAAEGEDEDSAAEEDTAEEETDAAEEDTAVVAAVTAADAIEAEIDAVAAAAAVTDQDTKTSNL